jgi:hypothetical protein
LVCSIFLVGPGCDDEGDSATGSDAGSESDSQGSASGTDGDSASSAGTASASGSASDSGSGTTAASTTSDSASDTSASTGEGDGCDCMLGAYVPACGVDGNTYDATCGTQCVPVEIACMSECPCPTLECGDQTCAGDTPLCNEVVGGPAGSGSTFSCSAFPETCDGLVPTCDCLASEGCDCEQVGNGLFKVTCYAP